jgi:hypothetical protein
LERDNLYIKEVHLSQPRLLFIEAEATTMQMQPELKSPPHLAADISSANKFGAPLRTINREKYGMHRNGGRETADWITKKGMQ